MKNLKLAKKVRISFLIIAIVLMVVLSITIGAQYFWRTIMDARVQTYAYAKTAMEYIDGDKIDYYATTLTKDEEYYEVQDTLEKLIKYTNIEYYYVFVPYEDNIEYIWDVGDAEGVCELGTFEEYISKDTVEKVYKQNPEEVVLVSGSDEYGFLVSAFSPVFDSNGNPVALVGVDMSLRDLVSDTAIYVLTVIVSVGVIIIVALWFYSKYVRKKVIKPIHELCMSVNEMVANLNSDKVTYAHIHTGDEIEDLANAFNKMDKDMREYISKLTNVTAEKERISTELSLAQSIQADMLPCIFPAFPGRSEFDIYATMNPAKEVGGDFYDFFLVDDNHIAMVMADVSGKGVPAALFMVIAKTLIKNRTLMGGTPSEILENVNNQLCEGNQAELFVTVWMAILDISTGKGIAANAGHEHPVIKRVTNGDGKYEYVKYRHSPAVATMEGLKFRQHEFEMNPGDVLYVYTDGVLEATNADNELYGEERLLNVLNGNSDKSIEEILHEVKADVDKFVGNAPQFDDITMLGFEYYGN
jgi:sigma-B regulation protein RsbU (phosphoserine phosphatase)